MGINIQSRKKQILHMRMDTKIRRKEEAKMTAGNCKKIEHMKQGRCNE